MESSLNGPTAEYERISTQPGMRNIAVTGARAGDRRTVVDTWREQGDPRTWLFVSAPHFNRESSHLSTAEAEEALINQMVCQMDLARSPKSRFRNLMKRNAAFDVAVGCISAAFVALTVFLVWIANLLPSQRPATALCILAFVAWVACIGLGAFHIARTNLIGRAVKRLRPLRKSDDIELATGEDDSRIERYMGDLVYVLNTNGYDNIVFEDVDTYRDMPLFERLRALNALANAQRESAPGGIERSGQPTLRFFYLVGDGLFDDPRERAEFFDGIVPVIPAVDPASALSTFSEGLAQAGIELDEEFLFDLAGFVDDEGVLRAIVNEARHYRDAIGADGQSNPGDDERLVAVVAYKTLFPRDFESLQNGQGYVSTLLKSRSAIIEEMRSRNAQRATELAEEQERALADGDAQRAADIQAELDGLDREDLENSRMPLSQLLASMGNPDAVFENPPAPSELDKEHLEAVVASPYFPFIRFAILGGWIDAGYERFVTRVPSTSLAAGERELVAAIAQGEPLDPQRPVANPFSVVSHLDADQFALPGARLYALLSHLLAYGPSSKLQALFAGIGHDGDLEWLLGFTESDLFNGSVFGYMEQFLDRPIARILEDGDIDMARRRDFCHRLLAFGRNALGSESTSASVLAFAQDDPQFLHVECTSPTSICEGLLAIGYRPAKLETAGCDRELLQYVYDHDLYQPTASVTDNLVASLLETETALDRGFLVTRMYSLKGAAVREVIEGAPERFVSTLLEECPVKLADTPEAIAWVLNLDGLPPARALGYCKALSDDVSIDRIEPIGNYTYQGVLLDRGLVECSLENVLDYFTSAGNIVDAHLAGFLEANPFPEGFTMAATEAHLGSESGFLKAVIECGGLSDDKVKEIALTYRAQFNHFDMEGIDEGRVGMLVKGGIIRATPENLSFLRKGYPGAAKYFARADISSYLELVLPGENGEPAECGFVRNEALDVFEMSGVADVSKIALLSGFSEPVSMKRSYTNELNAAIATSNFNVNDLDAIGELYAAGNRKLRRALAEAVVAHRDALADAGVQLSMELLSDTAWRLKEDRPGMLAFITGQLAGRDPEPTRLEVRDMFERANLLEYMALIDGPTAVIPDTPEDDALLAVLGDIGMAGKQTGKTDWQGLRRVASKGYSRK